MLAMRVSLTNAPQFTYSLLRWEFIDGQCYIFNIASNSKIYRYAYLIRSGLLFGLTSHTFHVAVWSPLCRPAGADRRTSCIIVELATRVSIIVADAIVLLVTWRVTYGSRKLNDATKQINLPLTAMLLRDGKRVSFFTRDSCQTDN